jgi:3-methylcrotonyl-CoA carboxylase alpha subunit
MPGKVLEVLVNQGQQVKAGEPLMVLEAMKMEHRIVATADGTVSALHFAAGDQVAQGAALLEIEESN